jgi:hypothetical protein
MQDDISIDIFSKNDDDSDLGEDFEDDFTENFEGPAPRRRESDDDDYDQKYEELRKSVSQLFFGVCTLFETVQARVAAEKGGEADAAASPDERRQPEARTLRSPTPWWAWVNLGLSGIVLLALFVSLVF